jgi:type IV pilus assembly protein PilM
MAALGAGVTIGSRTIRVLEVKRKKDGGWQVTKALIAPIGDGAASESTRLSEAKAALKTANSKARALVGLSGKELIIRYTQVPPVPDWRLEMLMNFEIQEVSEQSGGDVSAAYAQLGIDDATSGDNVVLVALAKNGHLVPRLEAAAEAGLDVLGGCPRSVAAFWAYKENARLPDDETVFFMHVGNENTDVAIARKGVLIFARNVAGGSKLFTDALVQSIRLDAATAEKSKITKGNLTPRGKAKYRDSAEEKIANALMGVAGHFVSAFNSSLMFAKAQTKVPDCQPTKLVLMGSGALLKGLPDYLESSLSIPVEVFDPIASLDLTALPEKTAEALKQDQGGMAVTLGLAQMAADDEAFRVEILPAADKKKRKFMRHTAVSIAAAVVLVACLVVSWTMLSSAYARAKSEGKELADKRAEFSKNENEMEAARKRVEDDNAEKRQIQRLVSMGPVFQAVTDAVHDILNETPNPSGEPGFPEIHFDKVSAKFLPVSTKDAAANDTEIKTVPHVEFRAVAKDLGARNAAAAFTAFSAALQAKVDELRGYVLQMNQLEATTGKFVFTVRAKAPAELAAEAQKASEAAGEENK